MPHARDYFVVRRAPGPAWDPTRPMRAQHGWEAHAAFMDALAADGFVVLGGPVGDAERPAEVLLVVRARDAGAVRARLAGDPWSAAELLRVAHVAPWTILLGGRPA